MSESALAQDGTQDTRYEWEEGNGINGNNLPVPKNIREKQKRSFIDGPEGEGASEEAVSQTAQQPQLPPRKKLGEATDAHVFTMNELIRIAEKQKLDNMLIYGIVGVIVVGALLGVIISQILAQPAVAG